MEASYILRCKIESLESLMFVQTMFSKDAPVFVEETDKQFHTAFNALEECSMPESIEKIASNQLEIAWLSGSDWHEELVDSVKRLTKAGASKIVGYYWMDEDEEFFTCSGRKLIVVNDWEVRFEDVLVEGDDKEITQCLSMLVE